MDALINLLVLLTVLSVVAERFSNLLKLKRPALRTKSDDQEVELERTYAITSQTILCGIAVALVAKADIFVILAHLEDPFGTLGWVHVENYRWMRSAATVSWAGFSYAIAGCVVTGLGLGFGSKFWHDILDSVYETRRLIKSRGHKVVNGGGDNG